MTSLRFHVTLGILASWLVVAISEAQQPPELGYLFPPVVAAGATTDVQLGGFDLTPDVQWFVHDERIELEIRGELGDYLLLPPPYWFGPRAGTPARPIPREVPARITVPADMPRGWVYVQVANANGSSRTARFYVSREEEILESRTGDRPQELPHPPIAVSGRLSRLTEVDRYQWTALDSGIVTVELMARRVGSDFLGILEVYDTRGELVADWAGTDGQDGRLSFPTKAGETYTIHVRDADFRGDPAYVYRLKVSPGFPARIVAQSDEQQTAREPTEEDSLPHRESSRLNPPGCVTRRLLPNDLEHRYSFNVQQGDYWRLRCESVGLGGSLDVELTLLGPDGEVLMENDDLPGTTDAGLEFEAGISGTYSIVVRDLTSRTGDSSEFYRLSMEQLEPGFSLTVPQQISLPLGGQADLSVTVSRYVSSQVTEDIVLTVDGLPTGVEMVGEGRISPDQREAKLTLQSANDAPVLASPIVVKGRTRINGEAATCVARAVAHGDLSAASPEDREISQVMLSLTMPPPFDLLLIDRERQREVHRGTTYRAEFEIVRHPGFEGELELRMAAQQARYRQGIRGDTVLVPPHVDRAIYPCFMPEWLGTDLTRRMVVHGVAKVRDPAGVERHLVKAADSRITMIMEGALLKVASTPGVREVVPGSVQEFPVLVTRSPKLSVPVQVHLEVPDELRDFCRAEMLELPADQESGTIRVHFDSTLVNLPDDSGLGRWTLQLIAMAWEEERWPVRSQVEIPIQLQLSPPGLFGVGEK
jgi:hypothetical protein